MKFWGLDRKVRILILEGKKEQYFSSLEVIMVMAVATFVAGAPVLERFPPRTR